MGGNVFKGTSLDVRSIARADVAPTVRLLQEKVLQKLGIVHCTVLGASLLKEVSGDVDLAVKCHDAKLCKQEILAAATSALGKGRAKLVGAAVCVACPVPGTDHSVQVDVFPVQDVESTAWLMKGAPEGWVKAVYRNLLLAYLAKVASQVEHGGQSDSYTLAFPGGLTVKRNGEKKREQVTAPKQILEALRVPATPDEADLYETLIEALVERADDKLDGFECYIESRRTSDPEGHAAALRHLQEARAKRAVRECVRTLLTEIDPGVDYGASLGNVFLEPFRDAAVAVHSEIRKLSTVARGSVSKLLNGTLNLLSAGFFEQKFDEIDGYVRERLREIESDPNYREVWRVITPHARTAIGKVVFLADPISYLTGEIAKRSPSAALGVAKLLLTDASALPLLSLGKRMDTRWKSGKEYEKLLRTIRHDIGASYTRAGSLRKHEGLSRLSEAKSTDELAANLFREEDFVKILRDSPVVKGLQGQLAEIADAAAQEFLSVASAVAQATALEQLEKLLDVKVDKSELEKLGGEAVAAETALVDQIKHKVLERLSKSVHEHLKTLGLDNASNTAYYQRFMKLGKQIAQLLR